jgi:hypothetical protein
VCQTTKLTLAVVATRLKKKKEGKENEEKFFGSRKSTGTTEVMRGGTRSSSRIAKTVFITKEEPWRNRARNIEEAYKKHGGRVQATTENNDGTVCRVRTRTVVSDRVVRGGEPRETIAMSSFGT